MKKIFTLAGLLLVMVAKAQVGIGTPNPKEDAILEILSTDKGVLIPRIGITDTTDKLGDFTQHSESLLIYNTSTSAEAVSADTKVTPGFYYWKDEKWHRIINDTDLQAALNGNTANVLRKSANVAGSSSATDSSEITLTTTGITTIGKIIKITVLDLSGNQITSAVTDVEKTTAGVKFRIGTGNMYNILFPNSTNSTEVRLLIEFSAS